jgi:glyoxylase-like metal-dependent hydrolase (beta-lactamase superfamily II)/8-oxo-dGTP pyrophosphatase MutT (NUDIX family)
MVDASASAGEPDANAATAHRPVGAVPAATVVLLRPRRDGLEALLTHRPTTMAFAADMHVFPGGRVDSEDGDAALTKRSVLPADAAAAALGGDVDEGQAPAAYIAAIRELFEEAGVLLADTRADDAQIREARSALVRGNTTFHDVAEALDMRLRTDLLVPLSRWVTPVGFARRFDTRFFAGLMPGGAEATFEGGEVVAHMWLRPADALAAMADGRLAMWLPTSTTLQQLEQATSIEQIRDRLAPAPLGAVDVERLSPGVTRILMPAGGGVAGQPVHAYLVGDRRFVLIDPGDPTGPAIERVIEIAEAAGGSIEAVALTHIDPDHAAGAEAVALRFGIPVLAGPDAGRPLPYEIRTLGDGERLAFGDVEILAIHTPGPRSDHVAFLVGDGGSVVTGDLSGVRGARMIPTPPDARWSASLERLAGVAPRAVRLAGHPQGTGTGPADNSV